jgi:sugar phosphate isomerase/epimerase
MKIDCPAAPHLTYCTNIHAGESWQEIRGNLARYVTAVKAQVAPECPFGVGLRLSARAAEELSAPGEMEAFRDFLRVQGLYVFTINGFPYGRFHGTRVKENVYLPDWLDDDRLAYTDRLASLLAELLPGEPGLSGSVSTVPGAFKPRVGPGGPQAMADRMLRHALTLHTLHERTGKLLSLALEPEPFCYLETIAETVSFFQDHLFSQNAIQRFARQSGLSGAASEQAIRRHIGVCFDACHMAVEFEEIGPALSALASAGIHIGKFQISAGLEVSPSLPTEEAIDALRPFSNGVYLHQVTERRTSGLARYLDLPEALAALSSAGQLSGPWRIHCHVPLFRESLGPFRSTQAYLGELLDTLKRAAPPSAHLEVETYTWDVLPEQYRREDIVDAVARELRWVTGRLTQ